MSGMLSVSMLIGVSKVEDIMEMGAVKLFAEGRRGCCS